MSNLWGRLKGKVDHASMRLHRKEKDLGCDDTVLSRAMIRFYDPDIPQWLESADHRRRNSDDDELGRALPRSSSQSQLHSGAGPMHRPSLDFLYSDNVTTESLPIRSKTFASVPSPRSHSTTQLSNSNNGRVRLSDKLKNSNW